MNQQLFDQFIKSGLYLRGWSRKTAVVYERAFRSFQRFQAASCEQQGSTCSTVRDAMAAAQLSGVDNSGCRSSVDSTASPAASWPHTLTKARLETWIISRREAGMSPAGINIYIRSMNSFLSWLKEEGYLSQPIKLKQLKAPVKQITVFSEADIKLILAFKPRGFYELRTWTLVVVLLDTGCRIDEILTLKLGNCDLDQLLFTVMGKGSKERKIPFSLELRKILFRYLERKRKRFTLHNEYVFCARSGAKLRYRNMLRDIVNLCKKVGITKRVHIHLTRHTFACHFMRNGGSIYTLSRLLGHSSISTTQTYIRGLGVEDFREEHSRLSPLSRH